MGKTRKQKVDDFAEVAALLAARSESETTTPATEVAAPTEPQVIPITVGSPPATVLPPRNFTNEVLDRIVQNFDYKKGRDILCKGDATDADFVEHHRRWFMNEHSARVAHLRHVLGPQGLGETLEDRFNIGLSLINGWKDPLDMKEPLTLWFGKLYAFYVEQAGPYDVPKAA
jgi:hypothetical protein